MKNVFIKKDNEKIILKNINKEVIESGEFYQKIHNVQHICANCDNCYADCCLKVFDEEKKPINEYSFIKKGIQIYDENGEIRFFYVTNCDNYVKDTERKKLSAEDLKRLKESIKINYFDAENIDEADQTQFDLLKRKQLSFSSYYVHRNR